MMPLVIPDGTTATLFFRLADTSWARERIVFGLSDQALPYTPLLASDELQVGRWMASTASNTNLVNHEGTGTDYNLEPFAWDTWYKIWIVVDNTADTWKVYMQGGSLATPTLLDQQSNGATTFDFRNGVAANDLIRFVVRTEAHSVSNPNDAGLWLDDIYLAMGENLSDATLPPPPMLSIMRSGDNVIVSWPVAATGYGLKATPSLTTPSWSDITEPQVPDGDQITVTLPISQAPQFFRLK